MPAASVRTWWLVVAALAMLGLSPGCGSGGGGQDGGGDGPDPGAKPGEVPGSDDLPSDVQASVQALQADLQAAAEMGREDLLAARSVPFVEQLGYDPMQAQYLDLIQASPLAMTAAEQSVLADRGFVIAGGREFPSFVYGYESIYMADLPVYISADSILDAVHRSYDALLLRFESELLIPQLDGLLARVHGRLADQPQDQTAQELDFYLGVARGLLSGTPTVLAGADQAEVVDWVGKLSGDVEMAPLSIELFGAPRQIDVSQFKPRGHYEDQEHLQRYFRTMIWLGRIDFRLVESVSPSERVLRRQQVDAMLLLHSLFDTEDQRVFRAIDAVVRAFVGESDNMTLPEVPALLSDLGIAGRTGLADLDDATVMDTILAHGFGEQQIMSHLMQGGLLEPVQLNASFLLFGQRYVVDSHVLANVTWDRVRDKRMMPDPLDAAFGALGNDQAVALLDDQLAAHDYAGNLEGVRRLVDAHPDAFWDDTNLYNDWLSALRALSPTDDVADPAAAGLPSVAGTEAWGRRLLNTQLASWAQLRHDTLLYAKQSFTGGAACEYPDAMVDPYPELYAALERFATRGQMLGQLARELDEDSWAAESAEEYFANMLPVVSTLRGMAEHQRTGTPFTDAQLAFVNDAVRVTSEPVGCTSVNQADGWYAQLFLDREDAIRSDPTMADVHTQPTDATGAPVGRVLHVATGHPRAMVVTADTCAGPRAYVGLASAYFERVTEDWVRVTDSEWSRELDDVGTPEDVPWMRDLVVR